MNNFDLSGPSPVEVLTSLFASFQFDASGNLLASWDENDLFTGPSNFVSIDTTLVPPIFVSGHNFIANDDEATPDQTLQFQGNSMTLTAGGVFEVYEGQWSSQANTYTIPEPTTVTLLGAGFGLMGLAGWRRRRK